MTAGSTTTVKANQEAVEKSDAYKADDSHTEAYAEIKAIDAQIDALKAARAELIAPIRADMETLEVSKIVDVSDATLFTLTTADRHTIDSKALRSMFPCVADYFSVVTPVTTFKVAK